MIPRPDLLDEKSPPGLEVFQLTTEAAVPSCHIYMEAQVFTPDSKRFLVHRSAHPHGSDKDDPQHRYLLCDLEDQGRFMPVTDETGATAPSISPDGKSLFYFVDETEIGGGRLTLKRRDLENGGRETIAVVDSFLPGTKFRPSLIYPLSTLRSDSGAIALSAYFGDGNLPGPWGLMVFDTVNAEVTVIVHGPTWLNMHPQYSRSTDAVRKHDLLIQENHGCTCDVRGHVNEGIYGLGVDIHVIRDDGFNFRSLPWGRDTGEACQGHQCWRGRSEWAITSTGDARGLQGLVESRALPYIEDDGLHMPGGERNLLSREFKEPSFCHFATDIKGEFFISDSGPHDARQYLLLARLGETGQEALLNPTYLMCPRASYTRSRHSHPFLSPDAGLAFFNSDESGIMQAYMIRNLPLLDTI